MKGRYGARSAIVARRLLRANSWTKIRYYNEFTKSDSYVLRASPLRKRSTGKSYRTGGVSCGGHDDVPGAVDVIRKM